MMLADFPSWLFLASICFFIYVLKRFSRSKKGLPLPPGPKGLPILGNVFDIPSTNMMSAFRDMNAKYGDLLYLNVLGRSMVIIGECLSDWENCPRTCPPDNPADNAASGHGHVTVTSQALSALKDQFFDAF